MRESLSLNDDTIQGSVTIPQCRIASCQSGRLLYRGSVFLLERLWLRSLYLPSSSSLAQVYLSRRRLFSRKPSSSTSRILLRNGRTGTEKPWYSLIKDPCLKNHRAYSFHLAEGFKGRCSRDGYIDVLIRHFQSSTRVKFQGGDAQVAQVMISLVLRRGRSFFSLSFSPFLSFESLNILTGSGSSSERDLRLLLQSRKKAHPSRRITITATPIPIPAFVPVDRLLLLFFAKR